MANVDARNVGNEIACRHGFTAYHIRAIAVRGTLPSPH
jgi:hypothetical protein